MKKNLITLQFSIHPMTNNFIEIIKGALQGVNTSNVTMSTDDVASTMIGEQEAVFDAVKAMIIHASKSGTHIAFNGTFSSGCPSVVHEFHEPSEQKFRINQESYAPFQQYVSAKFNLYPLGQPDYMDSIGSEISRLKNSDLYNATSKNGSGLHGDVHPVFLFLEDSFSSVQSHVVMTVNMSVNSPSHKNV
ncbi:YkoF family thiamine/hydroxymethylpyrimidine-binding protein [Sporosarcina sp. FA15]|uniref:YkoF family thiamine/hydroxymethylpyrimidine-binding protein n=1 Tax=Sporosarcina sp. FA15 TaxID=3413031 RepID=UPI003F65C822